MKTIFLDRDGTIIYNKPYQYDPESIEFLPNSIDGLKKLKTLGYQFVVISNQAGIARGLYTEKDAEKFNNELENQLLEYGIDILKIYFCPHHPEFTGTCSCRKPEPGMIERAIKDFDISPEHSVLVGDNECDVGAGKKCGYKTFFIEGEYSTSIEPDHRVKDLLEVYELLAVRK